MEKRRPKRGKNSYLNDFHLNLAGEYIYEGECYACRMAEAERKKLRLRLWALAALSTLSATAGGFIPAPGMQNCFYVLLPYVGELIGSVSVVWAFAKLGSNWESVREYTYERTVTVLPQRTALVMFFAALDLVGECVFLLRSGSGGRGGFAVLFCLLKLLSFLSALTIHRAIRRTTWDKIPKSIRE